MPDIPTGLAIATATAADRTTPQGFRKVLASLLKQSTAGVPVAGILAAPGTPLRVTGSSSTMAYTVAAGFAVTTRTGQGAYLVGSTTATTVPTAAANATNPRYDRIYIVQPDPELGETGHARIDVVSGTAAASPALPALPTGALELGRKLVPAGAANTNEGTAISDAPSQTGVAVAWDAIENKPTSFAPSTHSHTAAQISDPQNLDVGKVNGSRFFTSTSEPAGPRVLKDVWIDY